jgi:hypothetical protein
VAVGPLEADHNTTATGRAAEAEKLQGAMPVAHGHLGEAEGADEEEGEEPGHGVGRGEWAAAVGHGRGEELYELKGKGWEVAGDAGGSMGT